ncbi:MSHA biogenesis protein MshQ [Aeromonas bestiarum]|nr:MSHA biogenesis protein MshQ [Aeromonas bestiarum]
MKNWLLGLALLAGIAHGFEAIDTSIYFPGVAQGHRGNTSASCNGLGYPALTQNDQAKITGTGGAALNFCASNQGAGMPLDACDNADGSRRLCSITESPIRGLSISSDNSFLSSSGNDGGISFCNAGQQLSLGSSSQYQFSEISLYSTCTLTFSSARRDYRIQALSLGGAKVILPAGDYWIDRLIVNQGGDIETQGDVRIFVNSVEFNGGRLNTTNTDSVLLFSYQNINLNGGSLINALVYANQALAMNNTSIINGRTTSRSLFMSGSSAINDMAPVPPLTCFSDDFSASPLSNNWVVASSNGSFTPSIVNGRLGVTQASTKQSTSATYQRLFPAASNLVTIEFDHYAYGGNGADGMAVVLSDAKTTPQPGAFGGPLGYGFKIGIPGFAGGWLGVGIDEYGNYANEGGSANLGSRPQAVSIRGSGSGVSGYNYLAGTARDLIPSIDSGTNNNRPHRYRLTVDSQASGSSIVTVARNTGTGYVNLVGPLNMIAQSGQAAVPESLLLSLTGSTGDLTNAHEIDNVRICALRSNPVGVQIDHFQLDHSGQALTCNPETVTIKACADAACTTLITDPVTATLSLDPVSSSNGWIGGNTVTFSGGSTTVQLRNNTATAVTIGVSGSTPATKPFSTTLCKAGAGTPSAAACTLNFADSGFFFDVPDTYSNQPQTVTIKAVKKSDLTQQCVPGFASQSKIIKFWSSYLLPNSNNYNSKMSVNSSVIGTSLGTATPVSLMFDAQGQSSMTVSYPDAGQVQLDVRYDGTGNEAGLVMLGADQFVARPVGLCITPPQGVCAAGNSSCPVFKKAGETFQVDIKAMAWESANDGDICAGNQTTPNFVLSGIGLGSTLVAPSPGTNATLGTTSYNHVAAANSLNSVNQTVSEVGVFRMTATPPVATQPEGSTVSTGYFGYTIPPASSVPVGRFIPADFNLVSGDIVPACNVFSYMGQSFGVALDVLARNVSGGQTQNYTGLFAKGDAYLSVANNKDGKSLSARLRSLSALPWVNGRSAFTGNSEFVRLSDTQQDGPYKSLLFGLYMKDNDGERTLIASPDFNDAVAGNCSGAGCNARLIDSVAMQVYFGRLLAGTGAGLASAPLAVPLQMQYYEAGNWQLNKLDQCTQLSLANQGFSFLNPGQTFDVTSSELNLGGSRKIKLGLGSSLPGGISAVARDGEILFQFAKPDISVRIPYKVDLSKQPSRPLWLSDPVTLQGEAIFGSSRGNDRIIYRREVMP